jgi:hypothetical protein
MQVTTEDERLEIRCRYWRNWATNPEWGYWYTYRPNLKYNSSEEDRPYVLKIMQARIAKALAKQPANVLAEYKIVKVREIRTIEDIL